MSDNFRPGSFQMLTPIVKHLLIINVICFALDYTMEIFHIDLSSYLGLHYPLASNFYFWQYLTYMFMHANFSHIFFNMFALWMFGNVLERYWGSKRFLLYYLFCGIGAGLVQNIVNYIEMLNFPPYFMESFIETINTIGASGAVFGLLLAFGMTFPNNYIYLYFFVPIKAKWFVIAYGVLELISGISGSGSNIAHFAHLGGMLFGIILILIWRRRDKNRFYY